MEKKLIAYVALGVGGLAFLLLLIGLIMNMDYLKDMKESIDALADLEGKKSLNYKNSLYGYHEGLFMAIVNLIVFGVGPIIYGLKKLFCNCCAVEAQ